VSIFFRCLPVEMSPARATLLLPFLPLFLLLVGIFLPPATARGPPPTPGFTVIMTADQGTFSGASEAFYIMRALAKATNISRSLPFCLEGYEGLVATQPALVVMTGIGIMQAAMCMENILERYQERIERVFFLGTSGWSPLRGGVTGSPTCSPREGRVNRIGDVCISAASTNWDCHFCDSLAAPGDTVCQLPPCHDHGRADIFGPCTALGSPDLSNSLLRHAASMKFPDMGPKLSGLVDSYWEVTSQGTGQPYTVPRTVSVLGPTQCAEATSSTMWSGLPNEMLCRQYLGPLLRNAAPGPGESDFITALRENVTEAVTCVGAMEGAGWMPVLLRWQAARAGRRVPFVNVRAASNYVHKPLHWDDPRWRELAWLPPTEMAQFVTEGYQYAVATASSVVLQFLQAGL